MISDAKRAMLFAALKEVPSSGFSEAALKAAADRAEAPMVEVRRMFPHGGESLVEAFSEWADAEMKMSAETVVDGRLRDRIAHAVRARIEVMTPHKEAARRAAAFLALPQNAALAARLGFSTVDAMWRAVGDKTSDFNYYTKRALLAGVYGSTLLYWLSDSSHDHKDSWRFLDARIEDVMRFQKLRGAVENRLSSLPNPLEILSGLRNRRS